MKDHTRNAFMQMKKIRTPFIARKGIIKNKGKNCLTKKASRTYGENIQKNCMQVAKEPSLGMMRKEK